MCDPSDKTQQAIPLNARGYAAETRLYCGNRKPCLRHVLLLVPVEVAFDVPHDINSATFTAKSCGQHTISNLVVGFLPPQNRAVTSTHDVHLIDYGLMSHPEKATFTLDPLPVCISQTTRRKHHTEEAAMVDDLAIIDRYTVMERLDRSV